MNRIILPLAVMLFAGMLPALAQGGRRAAMPYTPTAEERAQLDQKKRDLAQRLGALPAGTAGKADAAVFLHIAEMADRLHLYANRGHINAVLQGLDTGLERCELLAKGQTPWVTQPGKTLRGYVSRIDGSVQPYAVVLPGGYDPHRATRLDVVLHGRGPTEVTFLQQNNPAQGGKAPDQPFMELQPFGRANNGWRWAGETDVFEALEDFRKQHAVDPDRTILRGFSMGGHGAWHIGVHYPSLWAAVSPGAGFTDTRRYLKIAGEVPPYQERAWHIYDAVDYALNLFDTPFIGYGGEKDPQLQATLNMKEAAAKEGLSLDVIIGPDTEHRYHPDSLAEIMRRLATHHRDPHPPPVKFVTWTLRYNQCAWVTVDGLAAHYHRAEVVADASSSPVKVQTSNVTALTLDPPGSGPRKLEIDGQVLSLPKGPVRLVRRGNGETAKWGNGELGGLRKRHGLQGPIDDAFMERFLVVRGTGTPWNSAAQAYADRTLQRFQEEWRLGFRGEVPVKEDRAVVEADWKDANLVLFGDPGSNSVLAKILDRLPIRWSRDGIQAGGRKFGPEYLPVLVYPNPLNPARYVVVNSGHTWTARDLEASNANLTPKLPDWAVLKPGETPEVAAADFFDEAWKFR